MSTDSPDARAAAGTPVLGAGLVLAASLLWGTTGSVATFAPTAASPVSVGAATMGVGGLLITGLAARRVPAVLRSATARPWALLGGVCVVIYPLAFYSAMDAAGVAIGTVVNIGSSPVFAALYERFGDGTPLQRRWIVSTVIAAAGCVAITMSHNPGAGEHTGAGVALGLLAGATYAGFSHLSARIIRCGHDSTAAMGSIFGLGACVLLPVLAVTGGPLLADPTGRLVTGYLAVVPMCLAYLLFGAALRRVTASTAVTISLAETVVAAILSVWLAGQRLEALSWAGVTAVVVGLVLLTVHRRR